MKNTTHKVSAAERNFNSTIDGWKALGLEVTIEENDNGLIGRSTTARVSARRYDITVFMSVTLRRPSRISSYCPRTSLRFFSQVWHGGKGGKVSAQTASRYLYDLCDRNAAA